MSAWLPPPTLQVRSGKRSTATVYAVRLSGSDGVKGCLAWEPAGCVEAGSPPRELPPRPASAPPAANRSPTSLDMWSPVRCRREAWRGAWGVQECSRAAGPTPNTRAPPSHGWLQPPCGATSPRFRARAIYEQRRCATPDTCGELPGRQASSCGPTKCCCLVARRGETSRMHHTLPVHACPSLPAPAGTPSRCKATQPSTRCARPCKRSGSPARARLLLPGPTERRRACTARRCLPGCECCRSTRTGPPSAARLRGHARRPVAALDSFFFFLWPRAVSSTGRTSHAGRAMAACV